MALGPADYRVFLRPRGGGSPLTELPWSAIQWERTLDDVSSASVRVNVTRTGQQGARQLATADAWEHEVSIVRDDEEIWVGPLVEPVWDAGGVTLGARDLFVWFDRRVLPFDRDFFDIDLASIFAAFAFDAMSTDPSPNVTISPQATGVTGSRSVRAGAGVRAGDQLRELARTGLDFTVIGRNVHCGGSEIPTDRLPTIYADTFAEPPQLRGAGMLMASRVVVLGASTGDAGVFGAAGDVGVDTGLVERTFSESSIEDALSAAAAARTRLDMLSNMPLFLTGTLHPRRAPGFDRLIPGAVGQAQLSVGVREVDAQVRLAGIRVDVATSDAGITEKVEATFIPLGSIEGA